MEQVLLKLSACAIVLMKAACITFYKFSILIKAHKTALDDPIVAASELDQKNALTLAVALVLANTASLDCKVRVECQRMLIIWILQ
ncbi:uncharacterized protein LOC110008744 isoform X2 [Jatropha curcas]|uniref:uncharacterized protein LOC110008744 isoform X2 n=1 Tax=Jatropha curcas TaxID=180498 RepID=UPI0009D6B898|nr:uncharacterized protein LOC110008744 isoform X2 [Jatropha curcas]